MNKLLITIIILVVCAQVQGKGKSRGRDKDDKKDKHPCDDQDPKYENVRKMVSKLQKQVEGKMQAAPTRINGILEAFSNGECPLAWTRTDDFVKLIIKAGIIGIFPKDTQDLFGKIQKAMASKDVKN